MTEQPERDCAFCDIVQGHAHASAVVTDDAIMTVLDVRRYHPGHVLVFPRQRIVDIRFADISTA